MADNLKPYDPNKGFISFRLNPDAIKEEAMNLIPWPVGTIAREMYRNPDGSIVETAKQVGRETPILGSLLSGEYSDAAKEAVLLGFPVKAKVKTELKKLGPDTRFAVNDWGDVRYYNPKTKAVGELGEDGITSYNINSFNPNNITAVPNIGLNELLQSIDASNSLHKLNRTGKSGKHPISFERDNIFNPYDRLELNNPKLPNNVQAQTLKEANELYNRHSGNFGLTIERRLRNQDKANKATPQLKKGETLVADDAGNMYIRKGKNNYSFDINSKGKIVDKELDNIWGEDAIPYSDPMLNNDVRKWQSDVKLYNAARELEDNYIYFDYNNPKQWRTDVDKAAEDYWKALNGPYFEDIMGYDR